MAYQLKKQHTGTHIGNSHTRTTQYFHNTFPSQDDHQHPLYPYEYPLPTYTRVDSSCKSKQKSKILSRLRFVRSLTIEREKKLNLIQVEIE